MADFCVMVAIPNHQSASLVLFFTMTIWAPSALESTVVGHVNYLGSEWYTYNEPRKNDIRTVSDKGEDCCKIRSKTKLHDHCGDNKRWGPCYGRHTT